MAIDYGQKRVGLAVTDPLKMIAGGLTTVKTHEIFIFLDNYFASEDVEQVVLGYPRKLNNQDSEALRYVKQFEKGFRRRYPELEMVYEDERFTSVLAQRAMIEGGMKKKYRQNKENTDKISAAIILQSYMDRINI